MNHGRDELHDRTACETALRLLIATIKQNQAFFAPRIPQLYEQLRQLVRYCRHHQRNDDHALSQALLQAELPRWFGMSVAIPPYRQLSLLAGLIRYVLVDYARLQQPLAQQLIIRGGVQLLVHDISQRLNAVTPTTDIDLPTLDKALQRLAERHVAGVRLLELRYFARLGVRDIALELHTSVATVERELRFARAWLLAYLQVHS